MHYTLQKLTPAAPLPMHLLLLADETTAAIEKYIYDSEIYVLTDSNGPSPLAVFALYAVSGNEMEIKNIAVAETAQGKGIGSYLLSEIKKLAKAGGYQTLIVGTADQGIREINFYERNGFRKYAVREDFFTLNYSRPILADNGMALKDMVMLKTEL